MPKSRIIFLNGVTSSGKTSIVEALKIARTATSIEGAPEECAEAIARALMK